MHQRHAFSFPFCHCATDVCLEWGCTWGGVIRRRGIYERKLISMLLDLISRPYRGCDEDRRHIKYLSMAQMKLESGGLAQGRKKRRPPPSPRRMKWML